MKIEIHIHHHRDDNDILRLLRRIDKRTAAMEEEIALIEQRVTELTTVTESSVALLDELAQLIRDNIGNPERLEEIAANIEARKNDLAAAVERNTDVDPTPPTLTP